MKKQVHKESQIQGTRAQFAEITAGIQMTMLLRMANSFNFPALEFAEDVVHETHMHDVDVVVLVKTNARGIGTVEFAIEGKPNSVWKLGGIHAVRTSAADDDALEPYEYVTCLNLAVLKLRSKYGETVAS